MASFFAMHNPGPAPQAPAPPPTLAPPQPQPQPPQNPPVARDEPLNLVCKTDEAGPPSAKRRSMCSPSQKEREDPWKRHMCSGCGHRSNWKWDINKHIRVAHPERAEVTTITMELEEAKRTLAAYMERVKAMGRNGRQAGDENGAPGSNGSGSGQQPTEGYYRPFMCTACGHR